MVRAVEEYMTTHQGSIANYADGMLALISQNYSPPAPSVLTLEAVLESQALALEAAFHDRGDR